MYPSMKIIRMNQKAALSEAQPQPLASSSPNRARPRGCVDPGCRACCAIVLHPSGRRDARHHRRSSGVRYLTSRVPFIVEGCTWHSNGYEPALSAGTAYSFTFGPLKNVVSPIATVEPSALRITTLWGAVASWLSNFRVKAVSALASSVVGSKPVEAAPLGAGTLTTGAFGAIQAPGAAEPPAPPPVSALRSQSGNGVAPGAGA